MTVNNLLKSAVAELKHSDSARLDAELLLAHVLGKDRSWLFAHAEEPLSELHITAFQGLLTKRKAGHPVAHLVGRREFWSLDLRVNEHTLIPRPETELLVEKALEYIPNDAQWNIADLGTGSGAIALAIAHERPLCRISATDISANALTLARQNAHDLGIRNVEFSEGAWLEPVNTKQFQVIVSNPPYIRQGDPHLQTGDVRFDPVSALVSGATGLECIEYIAAHAKPLLIQDGLLMFEHGHDQASAVAEILEQNDYHDIKTFTDLSGNARVTRGFRPEQA